MLPQSENPRGQNPGKFATALFGGEVRRGGEVTHGRSPGNAHNALRLAAGNAVWQNGKRFSLPVNYPVGLKTDERNPRLTWAQHPARAQLMEIRNDSPPTSCVNQPVVAILRQHVLMDVSANSEGTG